jgi:hypothetical protein
MNLRGVLEKLNKYAALPIIGVLLLALVTQKPSEVTVEDYLRQLPQDKRPTAEAVIKSWSGSEARRPPACADHDVDHVIFDESGEMSLIPPRISGIEVETVEEAAASYDVAARGDGLKLFVPSETWIYPFEFDSKETPTSYQYEADGYFVRFSPVLSQTMAGLSIRICGHPIPMELLSCDKTKMVDQVVGTLLSDYSGFLTEADKTHLENGRRSAQTTTIANGCH